MGGVVKGVLDPILSPFAGQQQQQQFKTVKLSPEQRRQQSRAFELQREAMDRVQDEAKAAPAIVQEQLRREQRAQNTAFQDARSRLQSLIARRNLGASSLGLSQEVGLERARAENLANLQASLPARLQAERERQTGRLSQLAGATLGAPGQQSQLIGLPPAQRTGGLLPLIGAGLGAYLGGPAGAAVGLGVGQSAQGYANQ